MSKSNGWQEGLILAEGLRGIRIPRTMLMLEQKCLRKNAKRRGGAAA